MSNRDGTAGVREASVSAQTCWQLTSDIANGMCCSSHVLSALQGAFPQGTLKAIPTLSLPRQVTLTLKHAAARYYSIFSHLSCRRNAVHAAQKFVQHEGAGATATERPHRREDDGTLARLSSFTGSDALCCGSCAVTMTRLRLPVVFCSTR